MDSIVRSWDATGIPRALWGDVPSVEPMFDVLKKLHPEEARHPCGCGFCDCTNVSLLLQITLQPFVPPFK